jgi:hypothetical protein
MPTQRAAIENSAPRSADSPPPASDTGRAVQRAGRPPAWSGRRKWPVIVVVLVAAGLLGSAVAGLLRRAEPGPGAPPVPPAAPAPHREAGQLPVPAYPRGTATLSDPTITTPKIPYRISAQWCTLLTGADVHAATGLAQRGAPDDSLLCTHYLADDAGFLFVSDIPAAEGTPYTVRGNTAIIYQSGPTACEVSVALDHGGGVLDIDLRGVVRPRVPLCEAAVALAARALDRLPDAQPR